MSIPYHDPPAQPVNPAGVPPGVLHGNDHQARLAAGRACLEAALDFLARGIAPTCCCDPHHIGVGRHHGKTCDSPGKAPLHKWKDWQTCLPHRAVIEQYWRDYPIGNVGCVLGQVSGLVRVDVDGAAGEAKLQQWSRGHLPSTWEFCSSTDGRGLLYTWPRELPCKTTSHQSGGKHEELRLMGNGTQTVLPPSRHVSGTRYTWTLGHSPHDLPLAPAPAWLLERLRTTSHSPRPAIGGTPTDYTEVASALAAIPNDDAAYDDWLLVGLALHSTEQPWAQSLWETWSKQSSKFDEVKQAKSWGSFVSTGKVQIGTLFYMAKQCGWAPLPPQCPDWHTHARVWAGHIPTIASREVPSWH
jgi:hypothetical protein